jgi:hypothetical protein
LDRGVAPAAFEAAYLGLLRLPLVHNTGGHDALTTLVLLDGVVDICMPFNVRAVSFPAGGAPRHAGSAYDMSLRAISAKQSRSRHAAGLLRRRNRSSHDCHRACASRRGGIGHS